METIVITMEDFLATIAVPKGILPSMIEDQARLELESGKNWSVFVGSEAKYVVELESLMSYFKKKSFPEPLKSVDSQSFNDFMENDADKPEKGEDPEEKSEPEPEEKPKDHPKVAKGRK
jgi:hypothetical protein